jgi:alkanesulfonate monooxygenase SsuD/methylene tetrahydromethanopterin reductase-like flavin-dependent oxidoreductase (luciferase family)
VDVGIGFPGLFRDVGRDLLLPWAQRAEELEFDCLSSGERLASSTPDLMVTMAMVGAVTERIRLMASVALLPLHSTGFITKQAATLDVLTRGRFTLGVGVGHRPQDYAAAQVDKGGRLKRFEDQMASMRRQWRGEPLEGEARIGPRPTTPGGPRLLIGPLKPQSARRAPLADGIVTFGTDPAEHAALYAAASDAWQEAGREGRPYFAAGAFFALGPDSERPARDYLTWFHGSDFVGDHYSRFVVADHRIASTIAAFADIGVDEIYFVPVIAELEQIDRLADLR